MLKVGVIGTGGISSSHILGYLEFPDECEIVALFISASMEGMTIFAGYEKPFEKRMPELEYLAVLSFCNLVKTLKPGELGKIR